MNKIKVIKRDGSVMDFQKQKIVDAICKAMKYGSGLVDTKVAQTIADEIECNIRPFKTGTVIGIERQVFHRLVVHGHASAARCYEGYRAIQEYKRKNNTVDDSIMGLIDLTNEDVMDENSNKDAFNVATQRDLIAGEVIKDISKRKKLPPHVVQAHENGVIHFHDMEFFAQPMFNCCLIDLKDMLDNGTVINKRMIESPKNFLVACNVMCQIIAQVSSTQYGGQSIDIKHLGKYLRKSYNMYYNMLKDIISDENELLQAVDVLYMKELKAGVQGVVYQINTFMTLSGQSPFVTLFLNLEKGHEYEKEVALIIEEILKQRIDGMKNEKGVPVTPAFPKLVYVLHEYNSFEGGEYDYLTDIAAECSAKRLYPDYISAKKMREIYEGNVFSPMGCRSLLSPYKDKDGNYKFEGRFNQGVVSLNLPQIGIIANGDMDKFWELLDNRLDICFDALMCRHNALKGTLSDNSPIHWQHGVIARLEKGQTIDHLLMDGYSTISLGYIGLYELTKVMTGKSHTSETEFALAVMKKLRETTDRWKKETGLGFGLYGSPAESLCYRFAKIDKEQFGDIEDITDKGYYTNSYHIDVREEISGFDKLKFESQFQSISSGGCISYIEIPNVLQNLDALKSMINYMYHNIQYSEFNTKSDVCNACGFAGEIKITDDLEWECPNCKNRDKTKMDVVRRVCGYLGSSYFNRGKTAEIKNRVTHLK